VAYRGLVIHDIVCVLSLSGPSLVRWHTRRHHHSEYDFHFFLGGEGRFENGNTTHEIKRGALYLSPPGVIHEIHTLDTDEPLSYYAVLFDADGDSDLAAILADPGFLSSFPMRIGTRQRIVFEDLKNMYAHPDAYRNNAARHQLASFIYDIHAGILDGRRTALEASEYSVHLERALALMQRRVSERVRLGEIADQIGVTPEHLIRLFTQRFGVTPMQYFRRLKLEAGGSMLINSRLSVKEISWQLGYANPFHFSRSFKAFSGVSPREFRRDYYRKNPMQYSTRVTG
jgi:AraC-like DNA-binding protein